jgi:hypothetical protein
MNVQELGEVLTRKQAAVYLHVCLTTLDWLNIPKTKARKRILYRKDIVDQWLVKNTETVKV